MARADVSPFSQDRSIHALSSRSLYTMPIYLPTYLHESGEGGNGEEEMRTRHISKSLRSNLSIWRRWIGITTDRNGSERIERTSGWDCEDTTTRAIAKNCRWPCVLLVALISEYRRGARARAIYQRGFDPTESIKIPSIFRATSDPRDQHSFSQLLAGSLKYEHRESTRRYGTYGETLNGP